MNKFLNALNSIFEYKEDPPYDFVLSNANSSQHTSEMSTDIIEKVYSDCNKNIEFIKDRYSILINSDIKIREFYLNVQNKQYKSFIFYIDGMINTDSINHFVLNPLMLKNRTNTSTAQEQIVSNSNKVPR